MKRRLLVVGFLLFATMVLAMPHEATAYFGFCDSCGQSCWNEANTGENNTLYWECRASHSQSYCDTHVTDAYYNACISTDCNMAGCSLPLH